MSTINDCLPHTVKCKLSLQTFLFRSANSDISTCRKRFTLSGCKCMHMRSLNYLKGVHSHDVNDNIKI